MRSLKSLYALMWINKPAANCGGFLGALNNLIRKRSTMKIQMFVSVVTTVVLLCTGVSILSGNVGAQAIDFSQIDSFESMGTGTQRGASPPKTIVDDGERHMVFITILETNTDAKVYWKSPDGDLPRTNTIRGPGVQAFQTAGEFRLEALGDENHSIKYGYVLFSLRKQ
jgi:hypothetical protein